MILTADEVDYNEETHVAEARGSVKFQDLDKGVILEAGKATYNLATRTGTFEDVKGSAPAGEGRRPGLLTATNPFLFQGKWAERLDTRYVLHNGFITDCHLPDPWWTLNGPTFDIIPGARAIAHSASFRVRGLPVLYTPYFYKSLEERPRKSGFLTPNIGNSSRRGKMVGVGYYWALGRSYDAAYRAQWFTQRGYAHQVDVRGRPSQTMDFDGQLYGVNDRGSLQPDGSRIKYGGYVVSARAKAQLPWQFDARADINYLSSFAFRQEFTESFTEAVSSEIRSIAYAERHWDNYGLNVNFQRMDTYQSTQEGDRILVRKLPAVEFHARDRQFGNLPLWFSLEASGGFLQRTQPLFQTRRYVDRFDLSPRLMAPLRWKDFQLVPSISIRETHYGSSVQAGEVSGIGVLRSTREFSVELVPPPLARIYDAPSWLGDKVKHVIESRAVFRWVGGVDDFHRYVRFDETEIVSNTRELELSLTNRLFVKRGDQVWEGLTWQLWQKRYFDPTLGGAIDLGARNVFQTQAELTAYAFFDGVRNYSPLVSSLRLNPLPAWGLEWRADYDPLRGRITNSSLVGTFRHEKYSLSAGQNVIRSSPVLSTNSNQFIGSLGYGNPDSPGWSLGFQSLYDFRTASMQFATTQATFNTDCCGVSLQYTRFGIRNDNQFRVAIAIANIGSFGTLRRQERLY